MPANTARASYNEPSHTNSIPDEAGNDPTTPNLIADGNPIELDTARSSAQHAAVLDGSDIGSARSAYAPSAPYYEQLDASRLGSYAHMPYDSHGYVAGLPAMHWQGQQHYDTRPDASNATSRLAPHVNATYAQQHNFAYDDPRSMTYRDAYLQQSGSPYAPPYNAFYTGQSGAPQQHLHTLAMRPHMSYTPQNVNQFSPGLSYSPTSAHANQHHAAMPLNAGHFRNRAAQSQLPTSAQNHAATAPLAASLRTPSYPRGPPRKPKQSGFAVWVGNLGPGTTIEQLKDYFSRGATNDIESVFLISKSNCAFVNYKSQESAQAAVARFHDSRLNGVRLVCRARHGQAQNIAGPAAPSTTVGIPDVDGDVAEVVANKSASPTTSAKKVSDAMGKIDSKEGDVVTIEVSREAVGGRKERSLEKFFVVKSLTLQDLEASVRDGIWATQAHNETALNEAYESAQTVYLIFSANKSGEYFGYARMRSAIDLGSTEQTPRSEKASSTTSEGPTSTPTPATDSAPPGRIVDDSARGTIFWEADSSSDSETEGNPLGDQADGGSGKSSAQTRRARLLAEAEKQDWGKPFKIEWVSTSRLPFYKTRGMRNPWNANREIKIARDGTELEPAVGRRLLDMFHESAPQPSTNTGISIQHPPGGPVIAMGSKVSSRGHSDEEAQR